MLLLRFVPIDDTAPCDFGARLVRVPRDDTPATEVGFDGIFEVAVEVLIRLAVPEGGLANEGMGARVCATEDREDLVVSLLLEVSLLLMVSLPLLGAGACDSGRGFCNLAEVEMEDGRAVDVVLRILVF